MRNDKYIEILRNMNDIESEHIESFYSMLKYLFKANNELRLFAEEYYKKELPIKDVAKELQITIAEAKRRRQVIIESLETLSEVFVIERLEDKHLCNQLLGTGNEEIDLEVELASLRKEIFKIDTRKQEKRKRKPTKLANMEMVNEMMF